MVIPIIRLHMRHYDRDMHARRNAAPPWAASSIQLTGLACAWLPLCRSGRRARRRGVPWLAAVLTLSMALVAASFWYWKRRAEQVLRCGELRLDEARRELRACEEGAREGLAAGRTGLQAAQGEQERLAQALFDSEQRLELHLNCASELVFVLDLEGRLQQLSSNWRGRSASTPRWSSASTMAGCCIRRSAALPGERSSARCPAAVRRTRSSTGSGHAEGDWRWHAARIAPLSDSRTAMLGLLGWRARSAKLAAVGRRCARSVSDP